MTAIGLKKYWVKAPEAQGQAIDFSEMDKFEVKIEIVVDEPFEEDSAETNLPPEASLEPNHSFSDTQESSVSVAGYPLSKSDSTSSMSSLLSSSMKEHEDVNEYGHEYMDKRSTTALPGECLTRWKDTDLSHCNNSSTASADSNPSYNNQESISFPSLSSINSNASIHSFIFYDPDQDSDITMSSSTTTLSDSDEHYLPASSAASGMLLDPAAATTGTVAGAPDLQITSGSLFGHYNQYYHYVPFDGPPAPPPPPPDGICSMDLDEGSPSPRPRFIAYAEEDDILPPVPSLVDSSYFSGASSSSSSSLSSSSSFPAAPASAATTMFSDAPDRLVRHSNPMTALDDGRGGNNSSSSGGVGLDGGFLMILDEDSDGELGEFDDLVDDDQGGVSLL